MTDHNLGQFVDYKYTTAVTISGKIATRLWTLRKNTQDEFIVKEVYEQNCYKLPDDLSGRVIIDIGANICAFAAACLDRGAKAVYCFDPQIYPLTKLHPGPVSLQAFAVVGDNGPDRIFCSANYYNHETRLTGGLNTFAAGGDSRTALSIQKIISDVTSDFPESEIWLKLDCEGSEYEIIASDIDWSKVTRIFGECHTLIDGKLSKDTKEIEKGRFPIEANLPSLLSRLYDLGYSAETEQNVNDPHLALFWAEKEQGKFIRLIEEGKIAEFQGLLLDKLERENQSKCCSDKGCGVERSKKSVAVLTPFRNARKYLSLYFNQLSALRDLLSKNGYSLRLVAAEGDSLDGTRERIIELSQQKNISLTLVDTTHGHMRWSSVEDPVRMRVMSNVMNAALSKVKESDNIAVWIMSDLAWFSKTISNMIFALQSAADNGTDKGIFVPLILSEGDNFYDTWAFRGLDGNRFQPNIPWHKCFFSDSSDIVEISSGGTCLVMLGEVARLCRAKNDEAVSFCADARSKGYSIWISPDWSVRHAPEQKGCILWISDAVCVSGFSRVAHAMFPILSESGYDLEIIALNFWGQPHNYPYVIWPASLDGEDPSGVNRLQSLLWHNREKYSAIVILDDPYNIPRVTRAIEGLKKADDKFISPPVISWVTVDGENCTVCEQLSNLNPIAITDFGEHEIGARISRSVPVIPFGVDTSIFCPLDKRESRSIVCSGLPDDAFVIGYVGTNQLRKNIYSLLECFSDWLVRHDDNNMPNAYLYLCLGPENSTGCDISSLVRWFNLQGKVIVNRSLLTDQLLTHVYNSFDVYMSLSLGEGFGLTALEAMACGIPCILSSWSGYSSWVPDDCALKIPCSNTLPISPLNSQAYVIGGLADKYIVIESIERLFSSPDLRSILSSKGLSLSSSLTWKASGDKLLSEIEKVIVKDREGKVTGESSEAYNG